MSASELARPEGMLIDRLGLRASLRVLGAKESFLLHRPEQAWVIADGMVDLFLLERQTQVTPQRHHLARLLPGSLMFGFAPADPANGVVLAVPGNGSRLACLDAAALRPAPGAPVDPELERGLGLWLEALGGSVVGPPIPLDSLAIRPGPPVSCAANATLAADRPVWLRGLPEGARLFGEIALPPQATLLAGGSWVQVPAAATLDVAATAQWWAGAGAADELAAWQALVLATARAAIATAWAAEQQRIVARIAAQRAAFGDTLQTLARIVERKHETGHRSSSRLFAACQIVAAPLGLDLRLPHGGVAALEASAQQVEDIAYASRVQTRVVRLTAVWWKSDHGPLLGFMGPDRHPCALLPRGGGYELVDPADHAPCRLTPAHAAALAPDAVMFYRRLPDRALTLRDLVSFCATGMDGDFITIVSMVLLSGLGALVLPLATQQVIATVIPASQIGQATMMGLLIMIAGLSIAIFQMVQAIALLRIEGRLDQRLQPAIWDRLLKLPVPFFRAYSVGDLANRAQTVDAIRRMLTGSIVSSAIGSILGFFSFGLMVFYAPLLSLVLALLTLLVAGVTFVLGRQVVGIDRQRLLLQGATQSAVFQFLGALAKLRVTATESIGFDLWSRLFRRSQELANRSAILNVAMQATTGVFPTLALMVIIAVIGVQSGQLLAYFHMPGSWAEIDALSIDRVMPTADFMAFITAYIQFSTAILGFIGVSVRLVVLRPMLERIRPLLEAATEGDQAEIDPGTLTGRIELRNVCFRYGADAPLVLRGISLDIPAGGFIALVGNSGGGRTTLVRLLLGFEAPESGSILLDGHDLARLDKRLVRQQLGVVLQDGRIISGTILENITAGGRFTEAEAWAAARLSGFDQDITHFAEGMQTRLADGAGTISGGQRQRLMIARALIRRARILIFDEATSALDNATQEIVSRSLAAIGATRIVTAHRVSAIRDADRIYVINDGAVAESGTYAELMAKGGYFAELVMRQTT